MDKKLFIKNRPFDEVDASQMQDWTENYITEILKSIYINGILNGLDVAVGTGMSIKINPGKAWDSNYKFIHVDSQQTVNIGAAHATYPRYDLVSIKYNTNITNNTDTGDKYNYGTSFIYSNNILDSFIITVTPGTAASSPTIPSTPSGSLALASIYIPANASSILAGNITDKRLLIQVNSTINNAFSNKAQIIVGTSAPTDTGGKTFWIDTSS
jgi:hypothetical protein